MKHKNFIYSSLITILLATATPCFSMNEDVNEENLGFTLNLQYKPYEIDLIQIFSKDNTLYCKALNKEKIQIIRSHNPEEGLSSEACDRMLKAINDKVALDKEALENKRKRWLNDMGDFWRYLLMKGYVSDAKRKLADDIHEKARLLAAQALAGKVSLETAKAHGEVVELLESNMSTILSVSEESEIKDSYNLIIENLNRQWLTLADTQYYKHLSFGEKIGLLNKSIKLMKKSSTLFYKHIPENQTRKKLISIIPNILQKTRFRISDEYSGWAKKEKDPLKIIDLHSRALQIAKKVYELNNTSIPEQILQKQHLLATSQIFGLCFKITDDISIYQKDNLPDKYTSLLKNIEILKKSKEFYDNYLVNPFIKFDWAFKEQSPRETNKKKNQNDISRISPNIFKGLPPLIDQDHCVYLLQSTYCSMLRSAGAAVSDLSANAANEKIKSYYTQKENDHKDLAFQIYKETLYRGEYKNNEEKEKEFIVARLESLTENGIPLQEFYAKQRQEHNERRETSIAQLIREHQDAIKQQELARQKQKAETERIAAEKRAAQQLLLQNKKGDSESPEGEEPFELTSSFSSQKTEPLILQREKIKKKGTPSIFPEDDKENKTVTTAPKINKIEPKIVILNDTEYYTYQCLIGECYDRKIKLEAVKKLLTKFNCKIENGGRHKKATAPNHMEWTIPPEWDTKILPPYRDQLMHFLRVDLGIDQGLIEVILKNNIKNNNDNTNNNSSSKKQSFK